MRQIKSMQVSDYASEFVDRGYRLEFYQLMRDYDGSSHTHLAFYDLDTLDEVHATAKTQRGKTMSFKTTDHRDYHPPLSQGGTALWHCDECGALTPNMTPQLCDGCIKQVQEDKHHGTDNK